MNKIVVFLLVLLVGQNVTASENKGAVASAEVKSAEKRLTLDDPAPFEVSFGNKSSSVKVVEYASLSCSHCRAFHENVFKGIKEKYADTGKIHFIFRHFPLNLSALKAAMVVACVPEEKRGTFVNVLFKTQQDWAFERSFEEKLKTIATLGGMTPDDFTDCMANQDLQDKFVMSRLQAASEIEISSTPTIFINGKKYEGGRAIQDFSKAIEAVLPIAESGLDGSGVVEGVTKAVTDSNKETR